ncbi:MAG: hypothetical protein IT331_01550 [Anaerolineae bacterium]|nr:hypothetical protein [Anaerolineae bacterium]
MRLTYLKLETFMIKIARTRADEVGCDDCAKHSARLVDALMQGNVNEQELQDLLLHVLQCLPCAEEFQILRDCARMDTEDSWPSEDALWRKIEREG